MEKKALLHFRLHQKTESPVLKSPSDKSLTPTPTATYNIGVYCLCTI